MRVQDSLCTLVGTGMCAPTAVSIAHFVVRTNRLIRRSVARRPGTGRNGLVLAMSTPSIGLSVGPGLLNQKWQVVYPIVFTYPARINNMGQIVFRIRDDKIGVRN